MAPLLLEAPSVTALVDIRSYRDSSSRNPAPSHHSGDLIAGTYRLRSVLADGGMGRVWMADSERLGGGVAVKMFGDTEEESRQESSTRLLFEGSVGATLHHPAIVKVLDFGITECEQPYIVMELLHGETLREAIDRTGGLSAVDAVRTVLPILGALECAHAHGIVHRDVKRDNIFLSFDDASRVHPKLIDFGLAKTNETKGDLEQDGMLFGSPLHTSRSKHRDPPRCRWPRMGERHVRRGLVGSRVFGGGFHGGECVLCAGGAPTRRSCAALESRIRRTRAAVTASRLP